MQECIVVLADVKGSRRRADRARLARRLPEALRELNRVHRGHIRGRFEVQKGIDEFGGVLQVDAPLGKLVSRLWFALHPVPVRLAIVQGVLDVTPVPKRTLPNVRAFDGPAFHVAAQGLDELRAKDRFVFLRPGDAVTELWEAFGDALYLHLLGWTPRQVTIVNAYRSTGSQAKVGRKLGISQPAVSDALHRAHARTLFPAIDILEARLQLRPGGG